MRSNINVHSQEDFPNNVKWTRYVMKYIVTVYGDLIFAILMQKPICLLEHEKYSIIHRE